MVEADCSADLDMQAPICFCTTSFTEITPNAARLRLSFDQAYLVVTNNNLLLQKHIQKQRLHW